jgi:hypothetical protein
LSQQIKGFGRIKLAASGSMLVSYHHASRRRQKNQHIVGLPRPSEARNKTRLRDYSLIYKRLETSRDVLTQSENVDWLGRQDSNLRMAAPKAAALPLGDAPTFPSDMSRRERALITARAILQTLKWA